jgi:fibro-slime domain-containing protein
MRATLLALLGLFFGFGCSSTDSLPRPFSSGSSSSGGEGGAGATGGMGGQGGISFASSSGTGGAGGGGQEKCVDTLTMRVRDFSQTHADFEWGGHPNFGQFVGVRTGILANDLAKQADGGYKPVYIAGADVTPNGPNYAPFTGAASFDAWYRDTPGTNFATNVQLPLTTMGNSLVYDNADFHPIDENFGFGNEGLTFNGLPNNWHFSTEALASFRYQGGEVFTFRGDDDIWVYINHKLAIDLGGLHGPEERSVNLDQSAADLGLVKGQLYDLQVFHAERNFSGSNYRFETSNFCLLAVDPPK